VYAPFSTAQFAYYYDSDKDSGSPDQTLEVQQGEVSTFTLPNDGDHRFYSTAPVVMSKEGSGSNDVMFVPPASREIIHTRSGNRVPMDSGTSVQNSQPYFSSESPLSSTQVADGSGTDADMGMPVKMLGDTYIVGHSISDYALGSIEPANITVYKYESGNWVLDNSHDHTSASRDNPLQTTVGDQSGDGSDIYSGPVMFTADAPFYLRTNDGGQEYSPVGYRTEDSASGRTPGTSHPYGGGTIDFEAD
jgi:hypothetical protein